MKNDFKGVVNMEKELKIEGIFYMTMKENETQEEAELRFEKNLESVEIVMNNSCCSFETQEL